MRLVAAEFAFYSDPHVNIALEGEVEDVTSESIALSVDSKSRFASFEEHLVPFLIRLLPPKRATNH